MELPYQLRDQYSTLQRVDVYSPDTPLYGADTDEVRRRTCIPPTTLFIPSGCRTGLDVLPQHVRNVPSLSVFR